MFRGCTNKGEPITSAFQAKCAIRLNRSPVTIAPFDLLPNVLSWPVVDYHSGMLSTRSGNFALAMNYIKNGIELVRMRC